MVEVTATPHLWRVNFEMPHGGVQTVQGYGETALLEGGTKVGSGGTGYLGLPPGKSVERLFDVVAAETVTTSAGTVAFGTIVEALQLFFTRWAEADVVALDAQMASFAKAPPSPNSPPPVQQAAAASARTAPPAPARPAPAAPARPAPVRK